MAVTRRGFLAGLAALLAAPSLRVEPGAENVIALPPGRGALVDAGYVLLNTRTREQVMVTRVNTDTLTVLRGVGSVPMPFEPTDGLIIVATPFEGGCKRSGCWLTKETYPRIVKEQA